METKLFRASMDSNAKPLMPCTVDYSMHSI
jgi:hypothetical protein